MKKIIIMLSFFCCIVLISSCGALNGGQCESYTDWKYDRRECDNNFWCIFKGQKATYIYYTREKQCENGKVQQTKKEKVKCGC